MAYKVHTQRESRKPKKYDLFFPDSLRLRSAVVQKPFSDEKCHHASIVAFVADPTHLSEYCARKHPTPSRQDAFPTLSYPKTDELTEGVHQVLSEAALSLLGELCVLHLPPPGSFRGGSFLARGALCSAPPHKKKRRL